MFNIGERVLHVHRRHHTRYVTCPDCFGQKYLTVILGDKSEVTIACEQCKSPGSDWSTGRVPKTFYTYIVEEAVVERIRLEYGGTWYDLTTGGGVADTSIFSLDCRSYAESYAAKLQLAWDSTEAEEEKKHNPYKSWAWHVRYHRQCVRGLEKDLAYHRAQLDCAKEMAKEEKGENHGH